MSHLVLVLGIAFAGVGTSPAMASAQSVDPSPRQNDVVSFDPSKQSLLDSLIEQIASANALTDSGPGAGPLAPDWTALILLMSSTNPGVSAAAESAIIARIDAIEAVAESSKWDLEEHRSVYTVTNRIGYGVAVVVHVILAITMWAAITEFRHASRRRKAIGDQVTEIAIGVDKVAVKTALHGLLLLLVGFGFYFMYVKLILPIV